MKTITVKDWTWQKLTSLKAELMSRDLDSVIAYLFVQGELEGEAFPSEQGGTPSYSQKEKNKDAD